MHINTKNPICGLPIWNTSSQCDIIRVNLDVRVSLGKFAQFLLRQPELIHNRSLGNSLETSLLLTFRTPLYPKKLRLTEAIC